MKSSLDTIPSDEELSQFKSPLDAFDAYSYDNGTRLKRSTRDKINEHMEARGLSDPVWEGDYDDIPPEGVDLGKG